MNNDQEKTVKNIFDTSLLRAIRRGFGGKPKITAVEGDKVVIPFEQVDSGNELMSYGDVAAYLNRDIASVRQMAGTRPRERAIKAGRAPFPMTINRGGPRIRRSELLAWEKSQDDRPK
jgi:hypothetical protein